MHAPRLAGFFPAAALAGIKATILDGLAQIAPESDPAKLSPDEIAHSDHELAHAAQRSLAQTGGSRSYTR